MARKSGLCQDDRRSRDLASDSLGFGPDFQQGHSRSFAPPGSRNGLFRQLTRTRHIRIYPADTSSKAVRGQCPSRLYIQVGVLSPDKSCGTRGAHV